MTSSCQTFSALRSNYEELQQLERQMLVLRMRQADGNESKAAGLLGVTRDSLNRRLQTFKLKGCGREPDSTT
ncbi:hypothetical protein FJY68_14450 [candidate division WOR-3 bacterium]|uniref:DNA binding HTH domain-containing protein n=1 Tax=candidate division WOR-3 bacterium TaxID=2052148 RepID=A0A937XK32_UNCW3|nr:hypothetical protein [candidate division WOR-3 bacterium]